MNRRNSYSTSANAYLEHGSIAQSAFADDDFLDRISSEPSLVKKTHRRENRKHLFLTRKRFFNKVASTEVDYKQDNKVVSLGQLTDQMYKQIASTSKHPKKCGCGSCGKCHSRGLGLDHRKAQAQDREQRSMIPYHL